MTILTVDDILSLSDEELARLINQNRKADGNYVLDCEGWENLPRDQRDRLAQRLQAGLQRARGAAESNTLDLAQVNSRLLQISDRENTPPRAPVRRRTLTPPPPEVYAARYYDELVEEGGRSMFPLSLWEQVSKDPEAYVEMLLPWQDYPEASPSEMDVDVFRKQLRDWKTFRNWQKDNRGDEEVEEFSAYAEATGRRLAKDGTTWQKLMPHRTEAENIELLRGLWKDDLNRRRWEGEYHREVRGGDYGFHEYAEAVKQRLSRHGFTRAFQLDEDPKRQDKLTTWIEYYNYACWWHDRHAAFVERGEPARKAAWEKLTSSGVLRPEETEQQLLAFESYIQRGNEHMAAMNAVKSAKAAAAEVLRITGEARKDPHSSMTVPVRARMIRNARLQLENAEEVMRGINRRLNCISEFDEAISEHQGNERMASHYDHLLRWILDQVSLIEAEEKAAEKVVEESMGRGTRKRRAQQDNDDDKVTEGRGPKWQKSRRLPDSLSSGSISNEAPDKEPAASSQSRAT